MTDRKEENELEISRPTAEEKDTAEESQYEEKSGEDHPGPVTQPRPKRPDGE